MLLMLILKNPEENKNLTLAASLSPVARSHHSVPLRMEGWQAAWVAEQQNRGYMHNKQLSAVLRITGPLHSIASVSAPPFRSNFCSRTWERHTRSISEFKGSPSPLSTYLNSVPQVLPKYKCLLCNLLFFLTAVLL